MPVTPPAQDAAAAAVDLGSLAAISDAVESGLGLPEVVRAAARALDASLVLIDRSSSVLAVAARSTADERALMANAPGRRVHDLRVGDAVVGRLRLRGAAGEPPAAFLRVVTTLIASEVERLRAPDRASEAAQAALPGARSMRRQVTDRGDIVARGAELGLDLARRRRGRRRARAPLRARRGRLARARAVRRRARRALERPRLAGRASLEAPGDDAASRGAAPARPRRRSSRRVAEAISRELTPACTASPSRSATRASRTTPSTSTAPATRRCWPPTSPRRAAPDDERRLAALAFEDTGAYRLLLPAMSEDPAELQRFYEETVAPLVAYDDQYETDLVQTLETFLDADGNVAGTAQRLYTHRHTVRYRLERVRDLTGLDVSSTDGRERLGLGLKAMRVLGIAVPAGPGHRGRRRAAAASAARPEGPLEDLRAPGLGDAAERPVAVASAPGRELADAAGAGRARSAASPPR